MSFFEPPTENTFDDVCPRHPECHLNMFCNNHWKLCCTKCKEPGGDHQQCNVVLFDCVNIHSVREYLPTALNGLWSELERMATGKFKEIVDKQEALDASVKSAKESINAMFQAIEARKNELLGKLDQISRENSKRDVIARVTELQKEGLKAFEEGKKATSVQWNQRCGLEMVNRSCDVYEMSNIIKAENKKLEKVDGPNVTVSLTTSFSADSIGSVFGDVICKNSEKDDATVHINEDDTGSDITKDRDVNTHNSYTCNYPYCGACFSSKDEFDDHVDKYGHQDAILLTVSNINFETSEETIKKIFEPFNPTNVKIARRKDGKSKGYGLVFFNEASDRDEAIIGSNGKLVDGRVIKVSVPKGKSAKKDFEDLDIANTVYFGAFDWEISEDFIKSAFKGLPISNIEMCKVNEDGTGEDQNCALVTFRDAQSYAKALSIRNLYGKDILASRDALGLNTAANGGSAAQSGASSCKKSRRKAPSKPLKNTLYVGRLPDIITDEGLHEIFDGCNFVEAKIHEGKNQKYGIVVFANEEDAQKALDIVTGTCVEGKEIIVEFKHK